ncbi:ATPase with role in protein import into the ER [Tulasnella sp. 417]|nr:ATPase with role in protein import into the ER [Tulasnella sp. 417]
MFPPRSAVVTLLPTVVLPRSSKWPKEISISFDKQSTSTNFGQSKRSEGGAEVTSTTMGRQFPSYTLKHVERVLKDVGMKKEDIDDAVLVTSSTHIPKVRDFFNGKKPSEGINPEDAVAWDAALYGGILSNFTIAGPTEETTFEAASTICKISPSRSPRQKTLFITP